MALVVNYGAMTNKIIFCLEIVFTKIALEYFKPVFYKEVIKCWFEMIVLSVQSL